MMRGMNRISLGTATRRALIGALTAIGSGVALGLAARSANAAMQRGAPPSALAIYYRTLSRPHGVERVWADVVTNAPRLAPYAIAILVAIALVTLGRAAMQSYRSRPRTAAVSSPNASPVIALAAAGSSRAAIARRTGLSQDAVALAMYLRS